jgi:trimethylamine--corrinoid protein Co-methyltransferase
MASQVSLRVLTEDHIMDVHNSSLRLLQEVGIEIEYQPAIDILRNAGQKVEGNRVFFDPDFVEKKVSEAPEEFTVYARDPEFNVQIGGSNLVYAPGYGAPFIIENGKRRATNWDDYMKFLKLAHVAKDINISGGMLVEPNDLDDRVRYLDVLYAHLRYSTKCPMGSSYGTDGAKDTIELLAAVFGGRDVLKEKPAVITLINTISPLKLDERQTGALLEYAIMNQPVIIASLVMAGSTGPATLAGCMAVQNAEVLAGITLAQTVSPGTPVIYGSASSVTDMHSGSVSIANGEAGLMAASAAQMAKFYGVPCRSGGGLTDSKTVDGQAGYESAIMLMAPVSAGTNIILHTAGILQYWLCMSFEKFVMDAEIAGILRRFRRGIEIDEQSLAFDVVSKVGPGNHFLNQKHTRIHHKTEFRKPMLSDRQSYEGWAIESLNTEDRAHQLCQKMVADYEDPGLDEGLQKELQSYINSRKEELLK